MSGILAMASREAGSADFTECDNAWKVWKAAHLLHFIDIDDSRRQAAGNLEDDVHGHADVLASKFAVQLAGADVQEAGSRTMGNCMCQHGLARAWCPVQKQAARQRHPAPKDGIMMMVIM